MPDGRSQADREEAGAALIVALHEGAFKSPLWTNFLDRLRRATNADYASLIFVPPGWKFEDALHLHAGGAPSSTIRQFYQQHVYPANMPAPPMIEGKVYSVRDTLASGTAADVALSRKLMKAHGITAIRQMRIRETTGVDAWLAIARSGRDFSARDAALLRTIAPTLRGVLRSYVAMERQRFAASLTAEAVRRLQFGWLALDRNGNVLGCDEQGALVLADSGVLGRTASGRLTAVPAELERDIFQALGGIMEDPKSRPRAITLCRDPWLDMLLTRLRFKTISADQTPSVIAYVHGDNWHSVDRCVQLAELFGLLPSEARLALALSRGMSISEAAASFGLTIETARKYSKLIYAKTGARGLPDLVRIVMRSVLAIAPDA